MFNNTITPYDGVWSCVSSLNFFPNNTSSPQAMLISFELLDTIYSSFVLNSHRLDLNYLLKAH